MMWLSPRRESPQNRNHGTITSLTNYGCRTGGFRYQVSQLESPMRRPASRPPPGTPSVGRGTVRLVGLKNLSLAVVRRHADIR